MKRIMLRERERERGGGGGGVGKGGKKGVTNVWETEKKQSKAKKCSMQRYCNPSKIQMDSNFTYLIAKLTV